MSSKYPLAALSTLRTAAAEQCATRLASLERECVSAAQQVEQCQLALDAAQDELRANDRSARARLDAGLERAADLALAADERRAREASIVKLSAELERAQKGLQRAAHARDEGRKALGRAQAEQNVTDKHRSNWARGVEEARAEVRDEEALERWTSEHAKKSGPA